MGRYNAQITILQGVAHHVLRRALKFTDLYGFTLTIRKIGVINNHLRSKRVDPHLPMVRSAKPSPKKSSRCSRRISSSTVAAVVHVVNFSIVAYQSLNTSSLCAVSFLKWEIGPFPGARRSVRRVSNGK